MTPREAKRVALETIVATVEDDIASWAADAKVGAIRTEDELAMVRREARAVVVVLRRRAARLRTVGSQGRRP